MYVGITFINTKTRVGRIRPPGYRKITDRLRYKLTITRDAVNYFDPGNKQGEVHCKCKMAIIIIINNFECL